MKSRDATRSSTRYAAITAGAALTGLLLGPGCSKSEAPAAKPAPTAPATPAAVAPATPKTPEAPKPEAAPPKAPEAAKPEAARVETAKAEAVRAPPAATAEKPAPTASQGGGDDGCSYANAVAKAAGSERTHGCADAEPAKPTQAGKTTHYGAAFALTDTRPLTTVVADVTANEGKTVRVSGVIAKVCKAKGCWFTLATDDKTGRPVRISMKDHAFFVPTDCEGKKAVVEGLLKSVPLPEAARKHLAEDEGADPAKVQGPTVELTLIATGVDLEG